VAAPKRRAGLKLESSCTLRDALDMQFQLLAVDFGESEVLLDGSAVENIDTAGLQMLVAFAKHHDVRGRRLQWLVASPELLRTSRLLGLDAVLGLQDLPAAGDRGGH
jgi:anti-anti-sigma regulatory factor